MFVTASLSETFGHPLAEAMAAGLPTVAADTPVHREICKDAADYFKATSAQSLVNAIQKLDTDVDFRENLKNLTLVYPTSEYSWDGHVDRLLNCFERAIAKRKSAS